MIFDTKKDDIIAILTAFEKEINILALPQKTSISLQMAFEEALTNIFSYAYPNRSGTIEFILKKSDEKSVAFELIDEGTPFNPLENKKPLPKKGTPIEDLPIGGLGIQMMVKLTDQISYTHKNGKNHLLCTKTIA